MTNETKEQIQENKRANARKQKTKFKKTKDQIQENERPNWWKQKTAALEIFRLSACDCEKQGAGGGVAVNGCRSDQECGD